MSHKPFTLEEYQALYQRSIEDPQGFWAEQAGKYIKWTRDWDQVLQGDLADQPVRWFEGAELNACENCLDRHLPERAHQPAIIWEGNHPSSSKTYTYKALHEQVCRLANGLKSLNLTKGDRVCLYMPMIPEAIIAMLACARIGLIHTVVFAGFSATALKKRIQDAECKALITAEENHRGEKVVPLHKVAREIVTKCPSLQQVLVVKNGHQNTHLQKHETWFHELLEQHIADCAVERMQANDPLFILYTSGSTGKPKGILHSTGGYLLYATMTFQIVFNYQQHDIYWCTADIGWITGHSYLVYGPLASGATVLMYEGLPTYPNPARYWEIIDKYQVNIFYTAPTAIRALMRYGNQYVEKHDLSSLKLLGTVGEPINPDVWLWYQKTIGKGHCPIVDTWWQTETGGIIITPIPGTTPLKPGSASWPFLGIKAKIQEDNLLISQPWPGQCLTIYNDPKRYQKTYYSQFPGNYCTGDSAMIDEDGYFWITGRTDDVINVSGHRLDTAEIESALVSHKKVAEAAVVGANHEIKGQCVYAYVTLYANAKPSDELYKELQTLVSKTISPIAKPEFIHWTKDLPKTRSGKIMRRILKKIANHDTEDLGDISTLANPEVVKSLLMI